MSAALASTALLMGLAGGPHCIAMCGAACAGIGQAAGPGRQSRGLWLFQLGRLLGYCALGALAAASLQAIGWLTVHSAALRPVWTLFHVAAALLGLVLLWQARQPPWLEQGARSVWRRVRAASARWRGGAPLAIGAAWAFMPCGLLYSALLVAAFSGSPSHGAFVMALFALGSGLPLLFAPWLLDKLRGRLEGAWGIRLAGLALMLSSGWALWMALHNDTAPWCVAP